MVTLLYFIPPGGDITLAFTTTTTRITAPSPFLPACQGMGDNIISAFPDGEYYNTL